VKSFTSTVVVASISIICILSIGLVSALDQNEASVSLSWSSQTIYQGGRVNVRITFQSNSADELDIEYIGIQFDWMASDAFYGRDLSINPVTIASGSSHTFEAITIEVPSNVSAGEHSYFVGIDGVQNYIFFSWNSPSSTIEILDASEKAFMDLVIQVQTKINAAINATYESAEAQSLLQ
jgi:hypothetical protein